MSSVKSRRGGAGCGHERRICGRIGSGFCRIWRSACHHPGCQRGARADVMARLFHAGDGGLQPLRRAHLLIRHLARNEAVQTGAATPFSTRFGADACRDRTMHARYCRARPRRKRDGAMQTHAVLNAPAGAMTESV